MPKNSYEILCLPAPNEVENAPLDPRANKDSCLLRDKSLRGGTTARDRQLSSSQKKAAEALRLEFNSLVASEGIDPLLFITLTSPDPVPDRAIREQIYEKFKKTILLKNFTCGFTVFDRSPTGRPHYHVIGVAAAGTNYRAGFDFEAWQDSQGAERRWNRSRRSDHKAEQQ